MSLQRRERNGQTRGGSSVNLHCIGTRRFRDEKVIVVAESTAVDSTTTPPRSIPLLRRAYALARQLPYLWPAQRIRPGASAALFLFLACRACTCSLQSVHRKGTRRRSATLVSATRGDND